MIPLHLFLQCSILPLFSVLLSFPFIIWSFLHSLLLCINWKIYIYFYMYGDFFNCCYEFLISTVKSINNSFSCKINIPKTLIIASLFTLCLLFYFLSSFLGPSLIIILVLVVINLKCFAGLLI